VSTKVVVRHFHEGNDADHRVRGIASYATVARVIDLDTGEIVLGVREPQGDIVTLALCETWAYCNMKDAPSRKHGRMIAVNRLQKQFPEACKEASFGCLEYLRTKSEVAA
jgi:hypothetical protein